MTARIDSIYCFDYTGEIGHYDSIRDFGSVEMTYIGLALSTPKYHVNAVPKSFDISNNGSSAIREYAISQMDNLREINENLAVNSPKYFLIKYFDGSERYYAYNESFYLLFRMALQYKPKENSENEHESPYTISKEPPTYIKPQNSPAPTQTYTSPKPGVKVPSTTDIKPEKASTPMWIYLLVSALIIIGIVGILANSSTEKATTSVPTIATTPEIDLAIVSEPRSGALLSGSTIIDGSELTVKASGGESCVVKLKTASGVERMSFYVRAGDTVTVGVPAESLYVYFASGKIWYGPNHLFGYETSYSMDDELCDFSEYTWEYTLYPVTNGNFSQTPIDPDDF